MTPIALDEHRPSLTTNFACLLAAMVWPFLMPLFLLMVPAGFVFSMALALKGNTPHLRQASGWYAVGSVLLALGVESVIGFGA